MREKAKQVAKPQALGVSGSETVFGLLQFSKACMFHGEELSSQRLCTLCANLSGVSNGIRIIKPKL